MSSPNTQDLRHASPAEVLAELESAETLSSDDLRATLANAFDRIATIEREWEGLGEAFRWLHKELNKSGGTT